MNKNGANLSLIFSLSKHAVLRMAQRNLSPEDLEYVIQHGKRINTTGIMVFMLRKRDIPLDDRNRSEITRLEGTVVLIDCTPSGERQIITTYRNKSAFKAFRCKAKYDARKRYQTDDHRPIRG